MSLEKRRRRIWRLFTSAETGGAERHYGELWLKYCLLTK